MSGARGLSLVLLLLILALAGCGQPDSSPSPTTAASSGSGFLPALDGDLTIFAATSLTDAFTEIAAELERSHPGLNVTLNFAGSSQLQTQLAEGARADVFASADERNMQAAQQAGRIDGEPEIFVRNRLVVIVPADNPAGIETLADLAEPGLKLVLAQPQVPAGAYTRDVLTAMSDEPEFGAAFADQVLANLVSEEANVRAVATKVQLGEADAGIVYASDVTPSMRDAVAVIEIPDRVNVIAAYPIATVAGTANSPAARAFIDYLLSPDGQETLRAHGFWVPSGAAEKDRLAAPDA